MRNMSKVNGKTDAELELELVDEFLQEKSEEDPSCLCYPRLQLPGPPPPPPDTDLLIPDLVNMPSKAFLVPRSTDCRERPSSQRWVSSSMSSPPLGGVSRRSGARAHTDVDPLERFLEKPRLVVTEEPKERGMRFRYECEGRSAGSILGASSTDANKTLPAIELQGPVEQVKRATITVSLVTKDIPYRPHPHCLVGKDCADGICVVTFKPQLSRGHSFANLGIQCVRRKELEASLEKRKKQKIDPFNTGQSKSIEDMDMNAVRLCFQCELEREDGEMVPLGPVVSNPVYDKKATTTSELKINRLNVVKGTCNGKTEIYMLCDKVQKDDIEIIFSLGGWEAKAEFAQTDVHRQIAVVFKSPPFQEQDIKEEVDVNVFLRRLSDRMDSEPVTFTYLPMNSDPYGVNRKRKMKTDINGIRSQTDFTQPAVDPPASQLSYNSTLSFVPMEDTILQPLAMEENPDLNMFSPDDVNTVMNMLFSEQHPLHDCLDALHNPFPQGGAAPPGEGLQDVAFYNDVQFSQLVNESNAEHRPQELPGHASQAEGCGLSQVKMESDP